MSPRAGGVPPLPHPLPPVTTAFRLVSLLGRGLEAQDGPAAKDGDQWGQATRRALA
jgi:hypothetical protein